MSGSWGALSGIAWGVIGIVLCFLCGVVLCYIAYEWIMEGGLIRDYLGDHIGAILC